MRPDPAGRARLGLAQEADCVIKAHDPRVRPEAGGHQRPARRAEPRGVDGPQPSSRPRDHARVEAVPAAGGVHHVDADRRDRSELSPGGGDQAALGAQGDRHPAGAQGEHIFDGLNDFAAAGQPQQLIGIGQEPVGGGQHARDALEVALAALVQDVRHDQRPGRRGRAGHPGQPGRGGVTERVRGPEHERRQPRTAVRSTSPAVAWSGPGDVQGGALAVGPDRQDRRRGLHAGLADQPGGVDAVPLQAPRPGHRRAGHRRWRRRRRPARPAWPGPRWSRPRYPRPSP